MINEELIKLHDSFKMIGSIIASTTSLDERGIEIIILRASNLGGISGESYSLKRSLFFKYYEICERGCFNLYQMKDEYIKMAIKHKEALKVLTD